MVGAFQSLISQSRTLQCSWTALVTYCHLTDSFNIHTLLFTLLCTPHQECQHLGWWCKMWNSYFLSGSFDLSPYNKPNELHRQPLDHVLEQTTREGTLADQRLSHSLLHIVKKMEGFPGPWEWCYVSRKYAAEDVHIKKGFWSVMDWWWWPAIS